MKTPLGAPRRRTATAVVSLLAATTTAVGAAQTAQAATAATQAVSFHGHVFQVPASWPVVDLTADPRACVRFDRHAVYLGTPGAEQDCPTHLVGRTEALLVEPATNGSAALGTTVDAVGHEIDAIAADVRVTGTYDTDQALVRTIIAGAGLSSAKPPVRNSRVAAGVAPSGGSAAAAPLAVSAAAVAPVPFGVTNYTGKGFDACTAPSSTTMSGWLTDSPYNAVGIYIGGADRACGQPNLTASWVQQQAAAGWHFMPLYVGLQASQISSPLGDGTAAADDAADKAAALGLGPGSLLYYDMENYAPAYSRTVLLFLSAWTSELHARGYNSAVYSSASSGMADLAANVGSGYVMPDAVFSANWNGAANTADPYIPASLWSPHQRAHQYNGSVTETWHGITIQIDQDYLDIGLGSLPPAPASQQLYQAVRLSNGNWAPFGWLDGANGAPVFQGPAVSIGAMPDGSSQVLGISTDGYVYHRARFANGTWSSFQPIDGVGGASRMPATQVSITGLPDGSSQVLAIGTDGNVYHRARFANGSWSAFQPLDGVGTSLMGASQVSIAGMPDGSAQVLAIGNDGNVYHRTRFASGSWSGFAPLDGVGTSRMGASRISIAGMPDGSSQVLAIGNDGNVYHCARFTSGNWSAFAPLDGVGTSRMPATQVSITGLPDGSSQVLAIGTDGNVYHRTRFAGGNWSAFTATGGANGAATFAAQRIGIAGMPDGSSQILATGR